MNQMMKINQNQSSAVRKFNNIKLDCVSVSLAYYCFTLQPDIVSHTAHVQLSVGKSLVSVTNLSLEKHRWS